MMDESAIPVAGMSTRMFSARTKDTVCSMQVSKL